MFIPKQPKRTPMLAALSETPPSAEKCKPPLRWSSEASPKPCTPSMEARDSWPSKESHSERLGKNRPANEYGIPTKVPQLGPPESLEYGEPSPQKQKVKGHYWGTQIKKIPLQKVAVGLPMLGLQASDPLKLCVCLVDGALFAVSNRNLREADQTAFLVGSRLRRREPTGGKNA